jgi:hypothetical protein
MKNPFSIIKTSFPDSIEIDNWVTPINAELSMNPTFRGITIDWSDDPQNAFDSICVKCESDSNVTDKSESQSAKHSEPRISTLRGIMIDLSDDW